MANGIGNANGASGEIVRDRHVERKGWKSRNRSSGIPTGFARSMFSRFRMDCIYNFCDMVMAWGSLLISMPMILEGSPRSVISHSDHKCFFISFISLIVDTNSNKSSTQMVIIAMSPFSRMT